MRANKDKNGQTIVGIPNEWYRKATPDRLTDDYKTLSLAEHIIDEWGEVVPPVYDPLTQTISELPDLDATDGKWKYTITNKPQSQIDAETDQREDEEASALEMQHEQSGIDMYHDIRKRIRLLKTKGQLTPTQYDLIRRNLRPAILPLVNGDFDIAKEFLDGLPIPPVGILRTILNTVKSMVDNYMTTEYSRQNPT